MAVGGAGGGWGGVCRGDEGGGYEKQQEIVASQELSVRWEVLGAALMGLTVFGKKGVEGLIIVWGCSDMLDVCAFHCMCMRVHVCACRVLA